LTAAAGINDLGDVAGTYFDYQGFQHGYLMTMPAGCGGDNDDRWARCQPTFESIDFPGAAQTTGIPFESGTGLGTSVTGLNNRREVAGLYATSAGYSNGFVFSPRTGFQSTDAPNASHTPSFGTRFFGVNDLGVMVGDYISQTNPHAPPLNHGFLLCGDDYTPIFITGSDLGGYGTQVNGVNDFKLAVGLYSDPTGNPHGFLWADGNAYQLNYPAALYTESHAINNLGAITGSYSTDRTGLSIHGYVAYPKGW
jgi:hypothetical protein